MTVANTTIQIKKSLVSGVTPSSLANGEIAINQADGKLFYSNPTGGISYIKNSQSFSTINADGSLILAGSPSDILSFANGQGIVVSGNTSSKVISYAIDSSVVTLSGSQTLTDKTFASSSYGTYPIRVKDIIENDVFKIYDSGAGIVSTWLTAPYLYFNNLKWPNVDGTNGQVLTTNGSGTLYWSTTGSGSGFVTTSGTETLTNKTLTDSSTYFQDESDNSKKLQFQLSGISTATTRTLTIPNVNGTIVTTGDSGTVTSTMINRTNLDADLLDGQHGSYYSPLSYTQSSFDKSNTATNLAQGAYDTANTDYTTISLTSGTYGNTTYIPSITVASNGRISSVSSQQINLSTLTIGTGLSGTSYNGSGAVTIAIDSTVATLTGTQTLSNKTLKPYNVISSAGSSISYEGGEQYTYGSTSPTSVFSYSASTYRSSKLIVQITQGTNYQVSEIMIIHNGTTTTMTEYGVMSTNGSLGTFTSDISGGNVRLLLTLGSATSSTVKTSYTLIVS